MDTMRVAEILPSVTVEVRKGGPREIRKGKERFGMNS